MWILFALLPLVASAALSIAPFRWVVWHMAPTATCSTTPALFHHPFYRIQYRVESPNGLVKYPLIIPYPIVIVQGTYQAYEFNDVHTLCITNRVFVL